MDIARVEPGDADLGQRPGKALALKPGEILTGFIEFISTGKVRNHPLKGNIR